MLSSSERPVTVRGRLNVNARPFVISPALGFNPSYNPRVDSIDRRVLQVDSQEYNSNIDELAEFLFEHKESFKQEQEYIKLMNFLKDLRK